MDKQLEERVLEDGIFKVSTDDRHKFLDPFTDVFCASELRFLYDVLGVMVFDNIVS